MILVNISTVDLNNQFYVGFVYGANDQRCRRSLWEDITYYSGLLGNQPLAFLGDFNVVKSPTEIIGCSPSSITSGMTDFSETISSASLNDLRYIGIQFTWTNNRLGPANTLRKLDRILVNLLWISSFSNSAAEFFPHGISDHSPGLVDLGMIKPKKNKPFKFYNFWTTMDEFLPLVEEVWKANIKGTAQFQLVHKLKLLKKLLKPSVCVKWAMLLLRVMRPEKLC